MGPALRDPQFELHKHHIGNFGSLLEFKPSAHGARIYLAVRSTRAPPDIISVVMD